MNIHLSVQALDSRRFGTGARQALALHCTMAHAGAWRGLAELMGDEITLTATDMLCHGKSPDWNGQGDFTDAMVRGTAAHLVGPTDVIGHSYGATVALRLALACPEKVRSLTLIESVQFSVVREDHPQLVADQIEKSAPFRAAMAAGDLEQAARLFNGGWGDDTAGGWLAMPEKTRAAMARGVQIVPACGPAINEDTPWLMMPGGLDSLKMPVLLMRGGRTEPIIAAVHDGIAARVPNAANVVVDAAGHLLPITHPEETAAALRSLFARAPF